MIQEAEQASPASAEAASLLVEPFEVMAAWSRRFAQGLAPAYRGQRGPEGRPLLSCRPEAQREALLGYLNEGDEVLLGRAVQVLEAALSGIGAAGEGLPYDLRGDLWTCASNLRHLADLLEAEAVRVASVLKGLAVRAGARRGGEPV